MAKTHKKYMRAYVDGVDLSGDVRGFGGPFEWNFDNDPDAALSDEVKNIVLGNSEIKMGALNAFFNSAAGGFHTLAPSGAGRVVTIPIGNLAAPAVADPAWCGIFNQVAYQVEGDGVVAATLELGGVPAASAARVLNMPWGLLLHPRGAETAVNAVNSLVNWGASSALGAIGYLQILATNGTCTFSVQHSANGTSGWATLLTFDAAGSAIGAEAKATALTATVNQYTRWQIAPGTATSVTFVMALCRRYIS